MLEVNPNLGLAIFAHYDERSLIGDDVIYFLRGLREVAEGIVFVSDSDLPESEVEKIRDVVVKSITGRHHEYDFGSYKRGFCFALDNGLLSGMDFLIFVNDSCHAPLFPLKLMFSSMSHRPVGFWGFTENYFHYRRISPHLQSFFLVFNRDVFSSMCFIEFMRSVKREKTKADIIEKYEVGLTRQLVSCGYQYASFIPRDIKKSNLIKSRWATLVIRSRSPFLKKSLFQKKFLGFRWPHLVFIRWIVRRYTDYPSRFL